MIITYVQIRDTGTDTRLEGVASVTLDGLMVIHDIKVISNTEGGYFLAMPSRRLPNGTFKDIVHPISKESRAAFEKIIIGCFMQLRESGADVMSFVLKNADKASMLEQDASDFEKREITEEE